MSFFLIFFFFFILFIIFFVLLFFFFFFFNDTATTEIYTLSLHDALPIRSPTVRCWWPLSASRAWRRRSEEHTSELQSRQYLVCRLLLEKKKTKTNKTLMTNKKNTPKTSTENQTNK